MTLSYTDILITVVIVGVVLYAAHRLGQVNPIGTGKLARRLSAVELKVAALDERFTSVDEKLDRQDASLAALAAEATDAGRQLGALRMEVAGDRGLAERTWESMRRIEGYFLEDAFRARRDGR